MTQIDWSKAPEGATHFLPEQLLRGWVECWYKNVDGTWFGRNNNDLDWYPDHDYQEVFIPLLIERQPEWTGSGLPPVGTVCEINNGHMGWVECEIVAHKFFDCGSKPHAIAWIDANNIDQSQGNRFRPLRTPAQLDAEKREKAIEFMMQMTPSLGHSDVSKKILFGELYDKGLRFEVKP